MALDHVCLVLGPVILRRSRISLATIIAKALDRLHISRWCAAIGLEGAGMPFVGSGAHRSDQPVEQIDGLVRQAGSEIEGDSNQGGVPTVPLVARDMLRPGAAGFTGELSKAGLMHTMPARRIEANRAYMPQTIDQTDYRNWLRCFRHLAQPGKPALVGFRPALRQRVQPMTLLGGMWNSLRPSRGSNHY